MSAAALKAGKWLVKASMGGAGAWSWAIWLGAGVVATAAGVAWHGSQVDAAHEAAFRAGQFDVQTRWDKAVSEAKDAQAQQNELAANQYTTEVEVVKTVYVDRIKEIKTYVPRPDTSCPADPGFLQRYNAPASPAGDAADQ